MQRVLWTNHGSIIWYTGEKLQWRMDWLSIFRTSTNHYFSDYFPRRCFLYYQWIMSSASERKKDFGAISRVVNSTLVILEEMKEDIDSVLWKVSNNLGISLKKFRSLKGGVQLLVEQGSKVVLTLQLQELSSILQL